MIERDRAYKKEMSDAWATPGWSEPRDSQRQKVYDAEYSVRARLDLSRDGPNGFKDSDEVVAYISKVVKSAWWKKWIAPYTKKGTGEIRVNVTRRSRTAAAAYTRIGNGIYLEMPNRNWAWNKLVVLHEIAHYPSAGRGIPSHGWLFCNVFLSLVQRFMGNEAHQMLRDEYDRRGVSWRRPRQLSDETRAILSERMTAIAADRWDGHEKKVDKPVDYVTLTSNQNWLVGDRIYELKDAGEVLDYWHENCKDDRTVKYHGRLCVTKQSIIHMAEYAGHVRYRYPQEYMSIIGLLKKMKRHSPDLFNEAVEDDRQAFSWLPYSITSC